MNILLIIIIFGIIAFIFNPSRIKFFLIIILISATTLIIYPTLSVNYDDGRSTIAKILNAQSEIKINIEKQLMSNLKIKASSTHENEYLQIIDTKGNIYLCKDSEIFLFQKPNLIEANKIQWSCFGGSDLKRLPAHCRNKIPADLVNLCASS